MGQPLKRFPPRQLLDSAPCGAGSCQRDTGASGASVLNIIVDANVWVSSAAVMGQKKGLAPVASPEEQNEKVLSSGLQ